MRLRQVAIVIALCGSCLLAIPQESGPHKSQQAVEIDFNTLRAQATAALAALQQSEHRVASVASRAF
jgi:hypothetical protein